MIFNEKGYLSSFVDLQNNRELCGEGYALNTFLLAEDVPSAWDNWDVDADIQLKFRDCAELLSRQTVSTGRLPTSSAAFTANAEIHADAGYDLFCGSRGGAL